MPRIRFPHSVIVKSPGLLPMHYKVSELAETIRVPGRTLRDWLVAGAPHFRDQRNNLWIHGRDFADWVASLRKSVKKRKLRNGEAFCMRCNKPVPMTDIATHNMQGKLILMRGKCPHCGCRICRGDRVPTHPPNNMTGKDIQNEK
jgi:hypothetical protein